MLPIGTGYQYSRTFEYIGATALELPNGNTFACVDYVVLCDGYYNLWASPMPNAFFPRNVVVYDNAPTDITGNIKYAQEECGILANQLQLQCDRFCERWQ